MATKVSFVEEQRSKPEEKPINSKLAKGLVLALVFLFPLFFTPLIVSIDLNKQALLILFVVLALFLWFFRSLLRGRFLLSVSRFDILVGAFLVILLVSTVISKWAWGSFWGFPQDSVNNLVNILSFAIFYLLIVNLFKEKDLLFASYFLIASAALVSVIGILQISGKFILPFDFTRLSSFNTIGAVSSFGIFLGAIIPLVVSLLFITKGFVRVVIAVLGLFALAGLVVSNYWLAWIGVLSSMILFLIFGFWRFGEIKRKLLVFPMFLFALAFVFGVFKTIIPGLPQLPLEIFPSHQATLDVSKKMLEGSFKDLILGWGPGTFKYGWSKYKDVTLNQTIFWDVRFVRGSAEVLESAGQMGFLSVVIFLLMFILSVWLVIKELLKKEKEGASWFLLLGFLSSFISLSFIKFLYPTNLSLNWLWWFLLSGLMANIYRKANSLNLASSSRLNFLFSLGLIMILTCGLLLFYFEGQRLFAEMDYGRFSLAVMNAGNLENSERLLLQAVRHNPRQEMFWQDLSQVYLSRVNQVMNQPDANNQQSTQLVTNLIASAVEAAKRATDVNSENVANWQVRGFVYKNLIGFSPGAFEWALKCYERALELEPSNPFISVELARTYLLQAGLVSESERNLYMEKAEEYVVKAIELKPDYAPAHFQRALVYEAQGRRKEAISILEGIRQAGPFIVGYNPATDIGLIFQLGALYYRDEQFDKAQSEFEMAIALDSNYSNARYFLGLIYDKKAERDKAIEQFLKIEELNPDNQEVKDILTNLRNGKPALEGITVEPETLPVEEKPE